MGLFFGILVSFVLYIFLQSIPILGPLLSGFLAGLFSGGSVRGVIAGLFGPTLFLLFPTLLGVVEESPLGFTSAILGIGVESLTTGIISIISILSIIISGIGGFFGGTLSGWW
jgi:hypothetical protein